MMDFVAGFSKNPLIAILRGLEVKNALAVADVLAEAGFKIIEVPLNSPEPFISIAKIAEQHAGKALIGAGTVTTPAQVSAVAEAGGRIIVSPNMNPDVGHAAKAKGLFWCPGVMTPSEAFKALELGASALKFFPAEMVPPKAIAALRAVLPPEALIAVVGGIAPDNMAAYHSAGANGFGLGSALFKPEYALDDIRARARAFAAAWKELA